MKISAIVPSKPGADTSFIRQQLKGLSFSDFETEFFFVSGTFPPAQRNAAITKSTGDYIFFLDDDVFIPRDLIGKTLAYFASDKIAAVGGPNLTPESDSIFSQLSGEVLSSCLATGKLRSRWKKGELNNDATEKELHGCFMCFRGDVIRKFLFPESLFPNDENELINRMRREGHKLCYSPECFVYHKRRETAFSHLRQVYISGRGRGGFIRLQGIKDNLLYLLPVVFLFYVLLSPFLYFINPYFVLPLILYFLFLTFDAVRVSFKRKSPYFLFMILLIFASHLAYGAGFIRGLCIPVSYSKQVTSLTMMIYGEL